MADVFSRAKRSRVMAAIASKNTKPELLVRQMLRLMGLRYRLHVSALPGKPDIVIPRFETVLQIKGCFWHGHYCLGGRVPATNKDYWGSKIQSNRCRDLRNERKLRAMGWHVKSLWECSIRRSTARKLLERLVKSMPGATGNGYKAPRRAQTATELSRLNDAIVSMRRRRRGA